MKGLHNNLFCYVCRDIYMNTNHGVVTNIEKGTILLEKGAQTTHVIYLLSGSIKKISTLKNLEKNEIVINEDNFIGIRSLYNKIYSATYVAHTDIEVITFPATDYSSFIKYLVDNPNIHENYFIEITSIIKKISNYYENFFLSISDFQSSILQIKKYYSKFCKDLVANQKKIDFQYDLSSYILNLKSYYDKVQKFIDFEASPVNAFSELTLNTKSVLNEQNLVLAKIFTDYDSLVKLAHDMIKRVTNLNDTEESGCIHLMINSLDKDNIKETKDISLISNLLHTTKATIETFERSLLDNFSIELNVFYEDINNAIDKIILDLDNKPILKSDFTSFLDFRDSFNYIVSYCDFEKEKREALRLLLNQYKSMTDKFSREENDRKLYKVIGELYYDLYLAVIKVYFKDPKPSKIIDLFLDYGFLDETLLKKEEIETLISLTPIESYEPCNIYTLKDWLKRIYDGKEMPSKNEFDLDYSDYIRQKKKSEGLSNGQETELINNNNAKLSFEVSNLFKCNNRLLNGNLSSFVPILRSDNFDKKIENMYLTAKNVNDTLRRLTNIDYSVFYREMLYADPDKGIQKELIQKEIYPEIIIFPVVGANGMMWQDTTGKKIDSPGRFLLPIMLSSDLSDTLIKMLGKFRWELSKSLLGMNWNNIRIPSLTAEYNDYVQFYRKNKELSPERKELLKAQITHCRNSVREVFIFDYTIWIKNEAIGAIRLNKYARKILATYCPFSKQLREKIDGMPLFDEAFSKYFREKHKKSKEVTNRYIALKKKGATITKELLDTEYFYKDL